MTLVLKFSTYESCKFKRIQCMNPVCVLLKRITYTILNLNNYAFIQFYNIKIRQVNYIKCYFN